MDTVGPDYKSLAYQFYEQTLIDSVVIQDLKLKLKETTDLLEEWSKLSREKSWIHPIDLATRTDYYVRSWRG